MQAARLESARAGRSAGACRALAAGGTLGDLVALMP
jgi:hypothetical protein